MLHIDNLCEFIKLIIDNKENGLFFPQNSEYVKTSEMVKLVGEVYGKKIRLVRIFNPIIKMLYERVGIVNKVFGNLVYDQSMSQYESTKYQIYNFKESICLSEDYHENSDELLSVEKEGYGYEQE